MKIVYKKSIVDQIFDAKVEAMRENKEIDYITLTDEEWMQLFGSNTWGFEIPGILTERWIQFKGINIYRKSE